MDEARVILIGLDGFSCRVVSRTVTPSLWRLGAEGGWALDGGRSGLPSTTYPGFVTLLTGASPTLHHVRTTFDKPGAVPGWAGQTSTQVPSLVDALDAAGIGSQVVMGDHLLYSVLGLPTAGESWPGGGRMDGQVPRDAHGYPTNEAVWRYQAEALADDRLSFVFCHLNEADTVGHDHGPGSAEATACYAATDRIVGQLLAVLRPTWGRTVVIVVSDHDMEPRTREDGIDPLALPGIADVAEDWCEDGGCAWLLRRAGVETAQLASVLASQDEILGWRDLGDRVLLMATPGEAFHAGPVPLLGLHGGPGTVRTVALVGGGHPCVPALARAIERRPPRLRDWAPTIAARLGVPLPDVDGRDLLSP